MSKWLTPGVLNALKEFEKLFKSKSQAIGIAAKNAKDFNLASHILALRNNQIRDWKDTFVYTLDSKFIFGKFKGNKLKHVWKVAPDYVEWCLLNAEGFIMEPAALTIMSNEPIIEFAFLTTLFRETNVFIVDLTILPINHNGFRMAPKEEKYTLSNAALNSNKHKLEVECDPFTIRKGGKWGDNKALIKLPKHPQIEIRG